jgi:5-methylcytosine-specific restriction endonuclease McrA
MAAVPETIAFDRAVRPLLQLVLPDKSEAVLNYRPDPALQARIDALAEKSTQGDLTEDERREYEGYVRANKFIAILRRQTRRLLETSS